MRIMESSMENEKARPVPDGPRWLCARVVVLGVRSPHQREAAPTRRAVDVRMMMVLEDVSVHDVESVAAALRPRQSLALSWG